MSEEDVEDLMLQALVRLYRGRFAELGVSPFFGFLNALGMGVDPVWMAEAKALETLYRQTGTFYNHVDYPTDFLSPDGKHGVEITTSISSFRTKVKRLQKMDHRLEKCEVWLIDPDTMQIAKRATV